MVHRLNGCWTANDDRYIPAPVIRKNGTNVCYKFYDQELRGNIVDVICLPRYILSYKIFLPAFLFKIKGSLSHCFYEINYGLCKQVCITVKGRMPGMRHNLQLFKRRPKVCQSTCSQSHWHIKIILSPNKQ